MPQGSRSCVAACPACLATAFVAAIAHVKAVWPPAGAQVMAKACQDQSVALGISFEAPLKEFVRLIKSAKATMADRSAALASLQQVCAELLVHVLTRWLVQQRGADRFAERLKHPPFPLALLLCRHGVMWIRSGRS
jgi:hypothetical protein